MRFHQAAAPTTDPDRYRYRERLNQVAEQNTVMMGQSKGKRPTKRSQSEAPSNNTKSPPLSVQSTSTPSQRHVQLRLHHALNSTSLSPLTVTPERRRPSGTTDPKPRPNKTMFKRTRHDPTGIQLGIGPFDPSSP
ncbi:unnamed protein product [Arctogadus glacialis]